MVAGLKKLAPLLPPTLAGVILSTEEGMGRRGGVEYGEVVVVAALAGLSLLLLVLARGTLEVRLCRATVSLEELGRGGGGGGGAERELLP